MTDQPRDTTVMVLMGGPDAERPVSLMSGRAVAAALHGVDHLRVVEQTIDAPSAAELAEQIRRHDVDVVFPVLHGQWGEGGPLQERLEQIGVPFVGTTAEPARRAMDKQETKQLLARHHVRTPPAAVIEAGAPCPIAPPLVLKPVDDGSSVDMRICATTEQVRGARQVLHARRPRLLAERYIAGRELTVGVLCGHALPVIEIRPAVTFYDYEAKYARDDTQYELDPDVPPAIIEQVVRDTLVAWSTLGLRDLARADFMLDEDGVWFLEINTMPGFTDHSLVPMAARKMGLEMPALCATLVDAALARGSRSARPERRPTIIR